MWRKPVLPIKGGLFVQLQGVASNELVRLTITAGGRTWRSAAVEGERLAVALVMCQAETYIGKDRWEWPVWVDGPPEELDAL